MAADSRIAARYEALAADLRLPHAWTAAAPESNADIKTNITYAFWCKISSHLFKWVYGDHAVQCCPET